MQRPEWGYTGMLNAVATIHRDEGIFAFWKGIEAVFFRNSICMLGMVRTSSIPEPNKPPNTPAKNVLSPS